MTNKRQQERIKRMKLILNSTEPENWGNFWVSKFENEFKENVFSMEESEESFLRWKKFIEQENQKGNTVFAYISYSASAYRFIQKQERKEESENNLPDFYALSFASNQKTCFSMDCKNRSGTACNPQGNAEHVERILNRVQNDNNEVASQAEDGSLSQSNNHKNNLILRPQNSKLTYKKNFQKIKNHIANGEIYQINLTENFEAKTKLNNLELFEILSRQNQVAKSFFLQIDDSKSYLSFSPETFLDFRNGIFRAMPIKGTIKRNGNEKEENQKLILDPKEKAELDMITDLLRNDLGMVCKIGSVKVLEKRKTLKAPSVLHAYSIIQGEIKKEIHPLDAIWKMLPAGSIIGCPKKRAIEIIEEAENFDRGIYTGVSGIIKPNWDMDWSVLIRGIKYKSRRSGNPQVAMKNSNQTKTPKIRDLDSFNTQTPKIRDFDTLEGVMHQIQAGFGGGIVYDSEEEKEYQEIFNKLESLQVSK